MFQIGRHACPATINVPKGGKPIHQCIKSEAATTTTGDEGGVVSTHYMYCVVA